MWWTIVKYRGSLLRITQLKDHSLSIPPDNALMLRDAGDAAMRPNAILLWPLVWKQVTAWKLRKLSRS